MKKIISIVLVLLFAIIFSGCNDSSQNAESIYSTETVKSKKEIKDFEFTQKISSDEFSERLEKWKSKINDEAFRRGGSFGISVVPLDKSAIFIGSLNDFYTKRYSDEKILEMFWEIKGELVGNVPFLVLIKHLGGYNNSSYMHVDDKMYEFFFLENENEDFIPALFQEISESDFFTTKIDWLTDDFAFVVYFSEEEINQLMENAEHLYMTFEGLEILPDNRIELKYPFEKYYSEEFPEIEVMIKEMEEF